ncbi:hypothetical protein MYP_1579 [Sporocytophaga myxococcoides]|uniref:DUF6896 domain-containing protein n=1 Tax=Sporocytophaga myxococcoides TaxID=153721 RepID=A0A098LBR2_9BACT|nr:hypothetical protein [Sporocytophaga myxococcoides]GAL84351.1 hypothetical protein MYP_1579 [Sporocytophaga myxococcoides]
MGTLKYEGGEISFRFHGYGCQFNFSGLIIDYDYGQPPDFNYEGFDSWKLFQFILSQKKYENLKDEPLFNSIILEMDSRKIIEKVNPQYHTFKLVE